jgi:hypothetical protein
MRTLGLLLVLGALAYTLYPDLLTSSAKKLLPPAPAPAPEPVGKQEEPVPDGESGDHLFPADLTS